MKLIHSINIPTIYMDILKTEVPIDEYMALPESHDVYTSISSHPDIFFFHATFSVIVHSNKLSNDMLAQLREKNIELIPSKYSPSGRYPDTSVLNAIRIGDYFLHNTKYTDPVIKRTALRMGLKTIHVDQGYTRCSVIPVSNNAIITSDKGIAKQAKGFNIDVLLISPGHVNLVGEKYGFIGGASGVLPDGKIIFLGDISAHPDFHDMNEMFKKYQVSYTYLPGLPLLDAGSLIFV